MGKHLALTTAGVERIKSREEKNGAHLPVPPTETSCQASLYSRFAVPL